LNRVKLGQAPISLHKVRWMRRVLWFLLVLAVIGGGLGLWLTLDSRFYIYEAEITGTRRLSHEEVFEASELSGLHILWARSGAIESRILEALPSLASVEADCSLPSECMISVVERRPRVLWDENGERWWVDEEGAVFLAGGEVLPADAAGEAQSWRDGSGGWSITGPLPRDDDGDLEERVRVALTELWESGVELPTTFQYDREEGLSFVDERGWRVIVGQGTGMARRLRILEELAGHLEVRSVVPRFVDVRFPDAPYYVPAAD
jgi:hypothetical protein